MHWFDQLLLQARAANVTDVHLRAGKAPVYRHPGGLTHQKEPVLHPQHLEELIERLLGPAGFKEFLEKGEADAAYNGEAVGRARINCYRERGRLSVAARLIPLAPPTLAKLGLAESMRRLTDFPDGLVIVAGPTGSGKSTTLAGVINCVREQRPHHVVTIEDPIEYVYEEGGAAMISQREVGTDTSSFQDALRAVLRQDPDVIVIGESRDKITMSTALRAAETGHLVFTTLHTLNVVETISRILEMFPADEHTQIRHALAGVLRAIVVQRMLPRADGQGRVVVQEVLFNTARVAHAIVDPEKTAQLDEIIADGRAHYGMQTFNQGLLDLVRAQLITPEVALETSQSPQDLRVQMTAALGRDPLMDERGSGLEIGLS